MQRKSFYTIGKHTLLLFLMFNVLSCKETIQSDAIYEISKSIEADSGMVVTAHPLASEIGLQILKEGGNAIDAAIAVQFALAVCYPGAGNIGGGGFMVYRDADGNTTTLDYREKAPKNATHDMYLDAQGHVELNLR